MYITMNNPGFMQTLHSIRYLTKHISELIVSNGIPILLDILQYCVSIYELQHFNGYLFIDAVDSDSFMAVIAVIIMVVMMTVMMMVVVMMMMMMMVAVMSLIIMIMMMVVAIMMMINMMRTAMMLMLMQASDMSKSS